MTYNYWTKSKLYFNIDSLLFGFEIDHSLNNYPLTSINLAYKFCNNFTLEILKFNTMQICGILNKGQNGTSIALNSLRDPSMQNFDCMHELIHYFFHKNDFFQCVCSESGDIAQDKFQEWQANEGAAQALVPYQLFIPTYVSWSRKYARDPWQHACIIIELSSLFNVSVKVISNRIQNLSYEIHQYLNGTPINKLQILSQNKLSKSGIQVEKTPRKNFCVNCFTMLTRISNYCPICGNDLKDYRIGGIKVCIGGVGYMIYSGVEVDKKSKAICCPKCNNDEVNTPGDRCKICGTMLVNKCTNKTPFENFNGELNPDYCDAPPADGNARYCTFCGCETTFYKQELLSSWKDEQNKRTTWKVGEF